MAVMWLPPRPLRELPVNLRTKRKRADEPSGRASKKGRSQWSPVSHKQEEQERSLLQEQERSPLLPPLALTVDVPRPSSVPSPAGGVQPGIPATVIPTPACTPPDSGSCCAAGARSAAAAAGVGRGTPGTTSCDDSIGKGACVLSGDDDLGRRCAERAEEQAEVVSEEAREETMDEIWEGPREAASKEGEEEEDADWLAASMSRCEGAPAGDSVVALDQLRALGVLGTGSFGRVYLVEDGMSGKQFALKRITKRTALHSAPALIREVVLMPTLNGCPFVVPLLGTFSDPQALYLLMDVAPGGDLHSRVTTAPDSRLVEAMARLYFACAVAALARMHERGVVHGDVKPENLVLDARGYLRLADFGCARRVGAGSRALERGVLVARREAEVSSCDDDEESGDEARFVEEDVSGFAVEETGFAEVEMGSEGWESAAREGGWGGEVKRAGCRGNGGEDAVEAVSSSRGEEAGEAVGLRTGDEGEATWDEGGDVSGQTCDEELEGDAVSGGPCSWEGRRDEQGWGSSSPWQWGGTPEYEAPEVGQRKGDARSFGSDAWALGCVLCFMLTGTLPLGGVGEGVTVDCPDCSPAVPRLHSLLLDADLELSAEVLDLVAGLLERDPSVRLGAGPEGVAALKRHPWLADVDWEALEREGRAPVGERAQQGVGTVGRGGGKAACETSWDKIRGTCPIRRGREDSWTEAVLDRLESVFGDGQCAAAL